MGPALPIIALVATVASTAVATVGALQQGAAAADAAKYNAQVAQQNAAIETQNAVIAGQAGDQQAANVGMKGRALAGAIETEQAARGVDVNTGSAPDVVGSTSELTMLDSLTARSNATREAYGYYTQSVNAQNESQLDTFQAKNDIQGSQLSAVGTFLGGVGQAGGNYGNYQLESAANNPINTTDIAGSTTPGVDSVPYYG